MRYPTVHGFLKWVPTAVGGGVIGVAAVWSEAKDWIAQQVVWGWTQLSNPWIAALMFLGICGYICAIIYTGGQAPPKKTGLAALRPMSRKERRADKDFRKRYSDADPDEAATLLAEELERLRAPDKSAIYELTDKALAGLARVARGFTLAGEDSQPSVYKEELARAKARRFADAIYGRPQREERKESATDHYFEEVGRVMRRAKAVEPPDGASTEPYSPIRFVGLVEAKDTPTDNWTAVRVVVRNDSDQNLAGLVARLVRAQPELGSLNGSINLPLILATKGRLDRLRNPTIQEQIPHEGFNLHAHSEKPIEVVWLHSKGALEGYITHEAGEADFLFVGTQELYVEVTGAGHPIVAGVRINVADDDIQSWTPELIIEAVGEAQGQS